MSRYLAGDYEAAAARSFGPPASPSLIALQAVLCTTSVTSQLKSYAVSTPVGRCRVPIAEAGGGTWHLDSEGNVFLGLCL
ncbi:hypothetical protein BP5796_10563 [Coleophoma crateriformis]|uniref:Uncharacterized protein n=1 Tax=Coleophoma crateriformis TaxID=565419 RepID=A0A3D8QQS1_9HELO|nr:hypothetical protein BP5796_10563 [Coleophoma crateriformis]